MPMPYMGGKVASDRRYYEKNRGELSAQKRLKYLKNREAVIARVRAYQIAHRESVNAKNHKWALKNPEKRHKWARKWQKKNAALCSYYARTYQILQIMAQPPWVKRAEIIQFYVEANRRSLIEGIDYQVDHIWPLRGKGYCGLHVPWNLQVITRSENARKGNRSPQNVPANSF